MHAQTGRYYDLQHSNVVDLCRTNVIKCIQSDTPCSEGYEVTNLTTTNLVNRRMGFLAERFIKPPINITLDFSSSVNVRHIIIHCKVGAQKTMGLELLSETHKTERQFESIGSGVLPDDKIGFVFHRHNETVTNSLGGQYLYKTFRSSRFLSFVDRLKIKIFRTSGSSVPALGKVEIWGNPCKTSNTVDTPTDKFVSRPTFLKDVYCQKSTRSVPDPQGQPPHRPAQKVQHSSYNLLLSSEKELQIPDEFIDPITCEIMSQPLIMPSGKIIDNSTLESYIRAEEKWGRGANDPFTGVLFTPARKPIVASELKIRIDRYLTKNSENVEFFGIPRTVGRSWSGEICKPSISNLVNNVSTTLPLLVNLNESSLALPITNVGGNQPSAKRQKLEIGLCNATNSPDGSSKTFKNSTSIGNLKTLSFQEMMDQSLEFSLKQTLAQLPKLTAARVCNDSKELKALECYICKLRNDLFSIPCKHYVCRNCLICAKARDMCVCQVCKSEFKSCDVVKIHLPS